mmetsp:Transcript_39544/g.126774  ORF Transcript_39544/g.126774 Transcript_39544/m.126774 type:complete len:169 (-) Transcript_39544:84-590(-)
MHGACCGSLVHIADGGCSKMSEFLHLAGDANVLPLDDLLARLDRDQLQQDDEDDDARVELRLVDQQEFFNLSSPSTLVACWTGSPTAGPSVGRGADFNFAAIRGLGADAAHAAPWSPPVVPTAPPRIVWGLPVRAEEEGVEEHGAAASLGGLSSFQRRLQGIPRHRAR